MPLDERPFKANNKSLPMHYKKICKNRRAHFTGPYFFKKNILF